MKKNKITFLILECIFLILTLFFAWKIFDRDVPEKRVAVILPESGDNRWNSLIKGMKQSAKINNLHMIICNTDEIENAEMEKEIIKELNKNVNVIGKACPLFVPLAEEGLWRDPVTDEIARRYLTELIDIDIDTLVLGCTHYPLIRETVGKIMGEGVTLVNPAYETARELKKLLEQENLLREKEPELGDNQYQFFVSDASEKFKRFANSIIKYGILSAKTINIEEY